MTVIKLLDPLGWIGESIATGDSEMGKSAILGVASGRLGEGVDVTDKAGLQEFDGFFKVIHLLLVLFFFSHMLLLEVVGVGFRGNDKSIDDGLVGGCVEGVGGDGTVDRLRGEPPKSDEVVDGGRVFSGGYWSIGSGSKSSRYAGSWGEDGWLSRWELLKRCVNESGGSWPSV